MKPILFNADMVRAILDGRKKGGVTMNKSANPYRKYSIIWYLLEVDWADLTIRQIAEVLGTDYDVIVSYLYKIKRSTGYCVPHATERDVSWRRSRQ